MADMIDRQEAVDAFQRLAYADWNQGASTTWATAFAEGAEIIMGLPSAHPEPIRPKARDVYYEETDHCEFKCSLCHATIGVVEGGTLDGALFRFCPNCGAKMEEGDE